MTDLEHFLVLLHSVPGIRDKTIYKILKYLYFEGISPTRFLEFDKDTYRRKVGLSKISSSALADNLVKLLDKTNKLVEEMRNRGFSVISIFDEKYPENLKIYMQDPPPILYIRGDSNLLNESLLALFNSRDVNEECHALAVKVAERFSETVVTGLYGKNYSFKDSIESRIVAISDRGIFQISGKRLKSADLIVVFSGMDDMGTPTSMILRDRVIMSLASTLVGICIRKGGNMVELLKDAFELEKEVFILENKTGGNIELLKLGIKPLKI